MNSLKETNYPQFHTKVMIYLFPLRLIGFISHGLEFMMGKEEKNKLEWKEKIEEFIKRLFPPVPEKQPQPVPIPVRDLYGRRRNTDYPR
jgi:hypothetical protein